jgi:hypothetical protein
VASTLAHHIWSTVVGRVEGCGVPLAAAGHSGVHKGGALMYCSVVASVRAWFPTHGWPPLAAHRCTVKGVLQRGSL